MGPNFTYHQATCATEVQSCSGQAHSAQRMMRASRSSSYALVVRTNTPGHQQAAVKHSCPLPPTAGLIRKRPGCWTAALGNVKVCAYSRQKVWGHGFCSGSVRQLVSLTCITVESGPGRLSNQAAVAPNSGASWPQQGARICSRQTLAWLTVAHDRRSALKRPGPGV